MKSNPLPAVSLACADTNNPGNELELAPGLPALRSHHPPHGRPRRRGGDVRGHGRQCLPDALFPLDGALKVRVQPSTHQDIGVLPQVKIFNNLLYGFWTRNLGRSLFGLVLIKSPEKRNSEDWIVPRSLLQCITPEMFFLSFLGLHCGLRHFQNILFPGLYWGWLGVYDFCYAREQWDRDQQSRLE